MKKIKEVSVRILTNDPYGNSHTLDVSNDKFGVLKYSFYGTKSRVPFCTSNMQMKDRLPDILDDFKSVAQLSLEVARVVNTGTESVDTIVFAKAI